MFHKVTKDIAKHLAPDGDLLLVRSLIDQDHFRPLYLLRRKPKKTFWMTHRYYKTGLMIWDILEPGEDSKYLDVQDSGSVTVVDCVDGRVEGNVNLPEDVGRMKVTGAASMYQVKSVKVKTARVSPAALASLKGERKIKMDHPLIEHLRRQRENLYVITEAVQTLEETKFYKSSTMEGSILNEIYVNFSLKGSRDSEKGIVVPKDCVLAFRIMPLIIDDESLGISYHPDDKTFVPDGDGGMGGVQGEVEKECAEFLHLSTDQHDKFLKSIIAMIINSDLLQELVLKLEEALEDADKCKLKSENPDLEGLINNLQASEGSIVRELAESVLYTLHALCELTEDQLLRLAQSAEKKIVSKQFELVKNILKQDFLTGAFSLDAELVSSLQEEELNITKAMMELGGVTLQGNAPYLTGTGDLAAFSALRALYVALYVLNLLSRSE